MNDSNNAKSPTPTRSSAAADSEELQRFRHDINLVAFAASRGYAIDEAASSRHGCIMRQGKADKIEISRAADGHWQYYSWYDGRDNGDIIQFVQNRAGGSIDPRGGRDICPLGKVRKELREWTHTDRPPPESCPPLVPATRCKDREAVRAEYSRSVVVPSHRELERRALTPATLNDERFQGTWRQMPDGYRNVIFPHRDLEGLSGFEVKNCGYTHFATGGVKGLWSSRTRPSDDRLVIAESAIDALSYAQLHPSPTSRYVSFAGGLNKRQPELLERAIARMPPGSQIVAATDRDHQGDVFAKRIAEMCAKRTDVTFVRPLPMLGCKDWNDHLKELRDRAREQSLSSKLRGLER